MSERLIPLFEDGTPDEPGVALRTYRDRAASLGGGDTLVWHADPANLGLLSRALRELGHDRFEVVLAANDIADDRTEVAFESYLVPTLRRLRDETRKPSEQSELRLSMTNRRPYVLPPPALDISTNDLCGLECNMCGNRAKVRDPHTITAEQVRALMDQAAAWGIRRVALTGAGEPFRDPQMLEHVRYANALDHLVTITTNGFPISEAIATELAERVVSVSVSIHGATNATHDAIVGVSKAGENAWRAVRRMVRARDARRGSKLSVSISTVIQRQNLSEIPALIRRAHEEGVGRVNVQPVNLQHGSFRGDTIVRRDDLVLMSRLWPRREEENLLDSVFDELERLKGELGSVVGPSLERLRLVRQYFRDSSRDGLGVTCRVGESFLAVDHLGRIKPCYRLPWSHGDARLVDVRHLWNSKAYARTRAQVEACSLTCLNNCFFRERRAPASPSEEKPS